MKDKQQQFADAQILLDKIVADMCSTLPVAEKGIHQCSNEAIIYNLFRGDYDFSLNTYKAMFGILTGRLDVKTETVVIKKTVIDKVRVKEYTIKPVKEKPIKEKVLVSIVKKPKTKTYLPQFVRCIANEENGICVVGACYSTSEPPNRHAGKNFWRLTWKNFAHEFKVITIFEYESYINNGLQ